MYDVHVIFRDIPGELARLGMCTKYATALQPHDVAA